jgi:hypothetical protein
MSTTPSICRKRLALVAAAGLLLGAGCEDDLAGPDDSGDTQTADGGGHVDVAFDTGGGADDASSDPSGDDADAPPSPVCVVSFFSSADPNGGEPAWTCDIPATSMTGCDDLARCVCEAYAELETVEPPFDIEGCVQSMTFPRGMITFSDFCPLSGASADVSSLADLYDRLREADGMQWLFGGEAWAELGDACAAVAGYTVWGEPHHWRLSLGREGEPFPDSGYSVADYPLEAPPLLEIDDVDWLERDTATLQLTDSGSWRLAERFAEADALVGREFLIHSAEHALHDGLVLSGVISSSRDRTVFLVEDLAIDDYSAIHFFESYPGDRPAAFTGLTTALLAAEGKLLDAACISTCGCPEGRACREGECLSLPGDACWSDADCCLAQCGADGRCRR